MTEPDDRTTVSPRGARQGGAGEDGPDDSTAESARSAPDDATVVRTRDLAAAEVTQAADATMLSARADGAPGARTQSGEPTVQDVEAAARSTSSRAPATPPAGMFGAAPEPYEVRQVPPPPPLDVDPVGPAPSPRVRVITPEERVQRAAAAARRRTARLVVGVAVLLGVAVGVVLAAITLAS
ncbi:hypothetical protein [Demequina pelophila]|uniref:hypothetical protein n=1 Tax=Demequina pelophila TaxID=1638984 RepID=UPI000783DA22|nr:hypothetical protein [Demequina pelophila]